MALRLPHIGPRARMLLRIVGYVALALVAFLFALQLTFPYERVKERLVEQLSSKYDVTIGGVDRGIMPGRLYFNNVALRTRQSKPEEPVHTLFIEKLQVDLGLLALIGQTASVDLDAKIGSGHLAGNISLSKGGTEIHLDGTNLPSQSLPMVELIGLPMSGMIQLSFDLDLPNEKLKTGRVGPDWSKAKGGVELGCPTGCAFGDGKAKFKPKLKNARNQAFAGDGIEFGKITLKQMIAKISIGDGQLTMKQFDTKSDDGELHVELSVALTEQFGDAQVGGCLRYNVSPSLTEREPKTAAAITTLGAPLGPDNLYHVRLDGKLKEMRKSGHLCGPEISGQNIDVPSGRPSRPNLTVQPPDEPVHRPGAGSGSTPTFNPPPPPAEAAAPADAAAPAPTPGPEGEAAPPGAAPGSADGHGSASPEGAPPPPPGIQDSGR